LPPDITAVSETGRILLLGKDEQINKQKIKTGAVSAQHTVLGPNIRLKGRKFLDILNDWPPTSGEVLNEIAYLISRFLWLHKAKANFPCYERGLFFFFFGDSDFSNAYLCADFLLSNS